MKENEVGRRNESEEYQKYFIYLVAKTVEKPVYEKVASGRI